MADVSHLDRGGAIRMVDVGDKQPTRRSATAEAWLVAGNEVMAAVERGATPKGNVYEAARLAGILAAKRTSELIPLCHHLPLRSLYVFQSYKSLGALYLSWWLYWSD